MNYSSLIRRLRKKLVLSQVELAGLLGVSFSTVNRWENDHNEPSFKMKRKIIELCKENKIKND